MKTRLITSFLLSLSFLNLTIAQISFISDITTYIVDYDPATMKKYDYKTDENYIVEENYTNYHLPIDKEKTLIFKVRDNAPTVKSLPAGAKKMNRSMAAGVDNQFVVRANQKTIRILLRTGAVIKEIDYIIYAIVNDDRMSYFAAPYMSIIYDYDTEHNPGEVLQASDDIAQNERYMVRYLQYGETQEKGIRKDIFLKMYEEACYNRPYGITTVLSSKGQSNPYLETKNSATGDKLYRSCQHPIHSEYLKGIGLYKEYYQEGDKVYSSKLTAINGTEINAYLDLISPDYKDFNDHHAFEKTITPDGVVMENLGEEKEKPAITTIPVSNNVPGKGKMKPENVNFGAVNTPKSVEDSSNSVTATIKYSTNKMVNVMRNDTPQNYHIVNQGDTLYSLSKKYKTSVDELKIMNKLEDNTIYTNQKLIIKAN
jgi:LysM repeat protein